MPVTNENLIEQETNNLDDLANNDFYCEKCYDMLNYFISECQTLSPRAAKFEKFYSKYKKDCKHYKRKYETLEFDYEEVKAQKEDLEERYNLLLKTLTKKSQPQEPDDQNQTALFSFQELSNKIKEKLSDQIVDENISASLDLTEQINENNQLVAYDSTTSIKLDMHFLSEQIIGKSTINCQLILDYFGKTINQVMKQSHKRLLRIKEPNQEIEHLKKFYENSEQKLRNEINELKLKLDKSNAEFQEANAKLLTQEENFAERITKANEQLETAILNSNSRVEAITADYEKQLSELNSFIASTDLVIENLMKEKCDYEQRCTNFSNEINQLKETELKYQQETIVFNDQLAARSAENKQLKEELQTSLIRLNQLDNGSITTQNLIAEYEQKCTEFTNEINQLKETELKNQLEITTLIEQLNEVTVEKQKSCEELNQLRADYQTVVDNLSNNEKKTQNLVNEYEQKYFEFLNEITQHKETELKLQQEKAMLNEHLETKSTDNQRLTDELQSESNRLRQLEIDYQTVSDNLVKVNELNSNLSNDTITTQSLISEYDQKCNDFVHEINDLKQVELRSQQEILILNEKLNEITTENQLLNEEMQLVSNKLNQLEIDHQTVFDNLKDHSETTQNLISDYTNKINQHKETEIKNQQEITTLNEQLNEISSDNQRLNEEMQTLLNKLNQIEIDYQAASEDLKGTNELNSNNLIGEYEQKLVDLNEKLATNEQTNQDLKDAIEQFRVKNTEFQSIIEDLNKEIDRFKSNQVEIETKFQERTNSSDEEFNRLLEEKIQEINQLKEAEADYNQNLLVLSERLKQSLDENETFKNENQKNQCLISQFEIEINATNEKLSIFEQENKNLQNELETIKTENLDLNTEIQRLNQNIEGLKSNQNESNESEELQTKLEDIQKDKDELNAQIAVYQDQIKQLNSNFILLDQQTKQMSENNQKLQLDNDYLNKILEEKLCDIQIDKAGLAKKGKQRFSEPVYLDHIKRQELIESNNSSWNCTAVSNIFLENSEMTLNKTDQTTSMEAVNDDTENIQQLQDKLSDLIAKCVNFENEKTVSDEEISQLRQEVTNLREQIKEARLETDRIINEYETKLAEGNHQIQVLKEENNNHLQQMNQRYSELESKYTNECQITSNLNNSIKSAQFELDQLEQKLVNQTEYQSKLELENTNLNEKLRHFETLSQQFVEENNQNLRVTTEQLAQVQSELSELKQNQCQLLDKLNDSIAKCDNFETDKRVSEEENCQLQQKISQLNETLKEYETQLSENKQQIEMLKADGNNCLQEMNQRYTELESKYTNECQITSDLNNSIKSAQFEIDQLKQKITNETDFQNKLKSDNTSLKEKLNSFEQFSQQFIEENNQNLRVKSEKLVQVQSELSELRQANSQLQEQNNTLIKKLNERDELFKLEFESLKMNYTAIESELQNKVAESLVKLTTTETKLKIIQSDVDEMQKEISTLRADLIQSEDENKKLSFEYEQKLEADLADLRQKSVWFELKYKDEAAKNTQTIDVYETKIKNLIDSNQNMQSTLSNDCETKLSSLFKEKEQVAREVLDLQRKLCLTLTEKDKILSESMQTLKRHETVLAQQKEIQSKLEHQISELRQEINIQQLKPKPSTVLNDSLSSKIDKQIEKGIEKKLEILLEEKRHHLDEIANYKSDIDRLTQQLKTDKEKLAKEHEKLSKEQQQLYQQKLKKQANEIKQLNDKIKDQQETNDFLTNQINNLNKQVFDLENEKENEDKENETNPTFVNKRLLEASLVEDGSDLNASKHLLPVNQNLRRVLDMSGVKTPMKTTSGIGTPSSTTSTTSTTSSNPDTPSTERKKSAQCAQQ